MNALLLKVGVRVWLVETLVSGFNFFVLMSLVYGPVWGPVVSDQIGMSTRIAYIFVFAFLLLRHVKTYTRKDLVYVGILWLGLEEIFEWVGSFAIGRSVPEILAGWNIFGGYMWVPVLMSYAFSNLVVGTFLHPGQVSRVGSATP